MPYTSPPPSRHNARFVKAPSHAPGRDAILLPSWTLTPGRPAPVESTLSNSSPCPLPCENGSAVRRVANPARPATLDVMLTPQRSPGKGRDMRRSLGLIVVLALAGPGGAEPPKKADFAHDVVP